MPELPEAETIARELNAVLSGRRLGRVIVTRRDIIHGDPRPLSTILPGRRVVGVHRRAKRVVVNLEPEAYLIFALGMTGQLTVCERRRLVERHTHLRIAIVGQSRELRFVDPRRFGGVWCQAGADRHVGKRLGEVGPEPLPMRLVPFRSILARRRQIKALLMDQRMIAGLGNIYCDESLHHAGVHPLRRADTLSAVEASRLLRSVKSTLRRAIRLNGTTFADYRRIDGSRGSFQDHHCVYGRSGQHCRSCGETILRITAAGRSTFFCPKCQPRA